MSNNPFEAPKADTLADAFPNVDPAIIDDILASANDNLEEAFDMMLKLSDPTAQTSTDQTPPQPRPPLPERRRPPQPTRTVSDNTNPFLNGTGGGTTRARQDLAQWRQELASRSKQRQAQRPNLRTSSSSSSFSSTIPQDWTAYGYDRNRIRDIVREGTASVRKAASFYNQVMTDNHQYMRNAGNSSTAWAHNARRQHSSSSASTLPLPSSSRISPPRSISNPSSVERRLPATPPTTTTTTTTTNNRTNRPLPPTPATNIIDSDNPFSVQEELPPPSYEAHHRDTYVDPRDIDRVLGAQPQRTNT
ncbi:predicted protein [Lichtheimia corymbifera JMRC:FSU:9682]|uniref:CUE domain-containing protein n=1 Tax=Lichtheimia corymbifera JMRC:FSU:9682 TaxID=1263082 RepID=A0A068RJ11_9FUNG|nr:predicted protein [Lichtheimia corymbifera JMRC:FSU:9682]